MNVAITPGITSPLLLLKIESPAHITPHNIAATFGFWAVPVASGELNEYAIGFNVPHHAQATTQSQRTVIHSASI